MNIPICKKCGSEMSFVSTQWNKTYTKKVSQWHCAKGHQNQYAYTRYIPVFFRLETNTSYWSVGNISHHNDLEDLKIEIGILKRDFPHINFRIKDLKQKRYISNKTIDVI